MTGNADFAPEERAYQDAPRPWWKCARCGSSVDDIGCLSSEEYCLSHPLPDREDVERGEIEEFEVEDWG